jgi:hypothetical protein
MACNSCHSVNQRTLHSRIFAHFSGFGVANRSVTVRPKLIVCVDCGRAVLHLPKDQLELLADRRIGALREFAAKSVKCELADT